FLISVWCFSDAHASPRDLPSFPTRRSSDLLIKALKRWPGHHTFDVLLGGRVGVLIQIRIPVRRAGVIAPTNIRGKYLAIAQIEGDRKSTRLNSSHVKISYAVFCLKKKKRSL